MALTDKSCKFNPLSNAGNLTTSNNKRYFGTNGSRIYLAWNRREHWTDIKISAYSVGTS